MTHGYSKDSRPDLKQFVLSTLCVDHAVPIWGKPEDRYALGKTLNTTCSRRLPKFRHVMGFNPSCIVVVKEKRICSVILQ